MVLSVGPPASNAKTLQSALCRYYTFETLGSVDFLDELTPELPLACDLMPEEVRATQYATFDGFFWTRWTSQNFHIPVVASIVYVIMIVVLKQYMAKREKMRLQPVVVVWNFGLSLFSFAGLVYCVPHLLFNGESGLLTQGFYPSVCSHASAYGFGMNGFFVCLFIYSKLAELLDTLWLLLRKNPVILLHWYHHVTVLLYCWHSYVTTSPSGIFFVVMNYCVHAVMYGYYFLMAVKMRPKWFNPIVVTFLQLSQMFIGVGVTVVAFYYYRNPVEGKFCHIRRENNVAAFLMYGSYFYLFAQFFFARYFMVKVGGDAKKKKA